REKHILAPAFLQQSIERKHFAAVFNEDSKKFEFSRCQIDDAAGAPDFVTSEINLNVSELKPLSHRWTRRAAKHRLNPRDEFARTERLCDVIVRAETESQNFVLFLAARGQQNDWRARTGSPQLAADCEAVSAGKHHVQKNEVELSGGGFYRRGTT